MLISEEILRHLVTVLEDRGPADEELAPAAAARSLDGDGDGDYADADPDLESTSEAVVPSLEAEVVAEPPEDAATEEPITDDGAEDVPAAEEPVAAETRAEKEPS
jgi:hypothetical protein